MSDEAEALFTVVAIVLLCIGIALMIQMLLSVGQKVVQKRCKRHVWSVHPVSDKLTCTQCNYQAGDPGVQDE